MRAGLTARMLLASGLLATIVAAAFAGLLLAIADQRDSAESVHRSAEVEAAANRLEKLVVDLQTGQRGFVVTRSDDFLEPWRQARKAIPSHTAELERLIGNPEQRERALEIGDAIREYEREWAVPVVTLARRDLEEARRRVAGGEGKRRVDAIRARFDRFLEAQQALELRREATADHAADRAVLLGGVGLAGSVALILLFAGYLSRVVARPVARLSASAKRLASGDLSARAPPSGAGEVRELGASFNAMASSLEQSRDELESQNTELELQTAELEDRQAELTQANTELQLQQAELERAVGELNAEKARVEGLYRFGERLAASLAAGELSGTILNDLCDFATAELGTLYAVHGEGNRDRYPLAAARGLDRLLLPELLEPGVGLAGRALAEGRLVSADYGETSLRLAAFGEEIACRHELHVPLCQGDRRLGVVTLARAGDRPFTDDERAAVEHLADQASVALANSLSVDAIVRLAGINSAVLDAAGDGIAMVDVSGELVLANTKMHEIGDAHGLRPEGKFRDLAVAMAERVTDPDAYRAAMAEVLGDHDLEQAIEWELTDSGRSFRRFTGPVRDADGERLGRIFVIREVTREREAERLKTELVATVSHELRTPLASVLGFAELLSERELDDETRNSYVGTIHSEALRLTSLINDFLDLQRIEEGGFTLSLEPVDVAELLRGKVELFSAQSDAHRLRLDLPNDGDLTILGDRERLEQVVGNLLSNAIKYSPAGGQVLVSAQAASGSVSVSVRDPGLGVPADQQQRIFAKFFRVDTSDTREIGGTGLGLALCKEIVEAHGGRIGFDSVEGEGSSFWFTLPAPEERRNGAGARRVLVIEDDPAAAALLSAHLTEDGHDVEVATTGEHGLARVEANAPALVCLDIGLAGPMDGWEVLSRLKGNPVTAHLPVVICTAQNGRERATALGASDFITKPFTERRIREAIARLLPAGRGSVLVVDDDPAVRRLVAETLRADGVALREAGDGEKALAEVARERPDVIVLDLVMPGLDGFGVLERLQEDPATRQIPVLILTARQLSVADREALRNRAVALLEKSSYSPGELRALVRSALSE